MVGIACRGGGGFEVSVKMHFRLYTSTARTARTWVQRTRGRAPKSVVQTHTTRAHKRTRHASTGARERAGTRARRYEVGRNSTGVIRLLIIVNQKKKKYWYNGRGNEVCCAVLLPKQFYRGQLLPMFCY